MPESSPVQAVGFPGQGGDWRAAIAILGAHPDAPEAVALADRLGTDRWTDLDQRDTRASQPVVVASGLLGARLAGLGAARPLGVVGHSLGEITAACFAGALTLESALDLAVLRAELGHRAEAERPGQMVAVMRLPVAEVEWLRRSVLARRPGVLEVAVVNSPTQVVLSGDRALGEAVLVEVEAAGGVGHRLPIGGAFHSPVMAGAVAPFAEALRAALRRPRLPVVTSALPAARTDPGELADAMARCLVLPVDWPGTIAALAGLGVTAAVDAGPGDTLVRLARYEPGVAFSPLPAVDPT